MFERTAPERFDSLPDIPEPSENPILVGHERAAEMLAGAYRAGKLHHGLLFAGPPGIGKATLAFHLANHLFFEPAAGDRATALFAARSHRTGVSARGAGCASVSAPSDASLR